GRRRDAHLARRDRPRAGTLDAGIEIAVDDVVPGAARPAHCKGADEEQREVAQVDRGSGRYRGERGRPPARNQQEPGADRPVEASEPQIRARRGRSEAVDPIPGRIGDATGAAGHRPSGLPESVSNVCPFDAVAASGTIGVLPSASLSVGPVCFGIAATSQTCLPICEALPWFSLTALMTSGGTPQVALSSSMPLIILVSEARNALKSLQISSGGAFFWPA